MAAADTDRANTAAAMGASVVRVPADSSQQQQMGYGQQQPIYVQQQRPSGGAGAAAGAGCCGELQQLFLVPSHADISRTVWCPPVL